MSASIHSLEYRRLIASLYPSAPQRNAGVHPAMSGFVNRLCPPTPTSQVEADIIRSTKNGGLSGCPVGR